MYSPQRQRAIEVFQAVGELTPKRLSEHLNFSPEAARALVRRMVADGILRRSEGGYVLREGADNDNQSTYHRESTTGIADGDDGDVAETESHGESNADEDDELPYSPSGIWEWNAPRGRPEPWVNPYAT